MRERKNIEVDRFIQFKRLQKKKNTNSNLRTANEENEEKNNIQYLYQTKCFVVTIATTEACSILLQCIR